MKTNTSVCFYFGCIQQPMQDRKGCRGSQIMHQLQQQNSSVNRTQQMFEECSFSTSKVEEELLFQFELQRNICSQYIKIASNQLHFQEAQVLSTANDLLQKLSTREKVKDLSEWDVFSTRDSVIIQDQSSFNLSTLSVQTRGKLIQRRSTLTSRNVKQNEQSLVQCVVEIEKQCSTKTSTTVRKIVEEYKKLKGRVFQLQKKDKGMKLKQKILEELQQKNVLLNNKIEQIERDLAKSKADFSALKAQNNQLLGFIRKKTEEANSQRKIKIYQEIIQHQYSSGKKQSRKNINTSISIQVLNDLIQQKQHLINLRYNEVKSLQQKIQRSLFNEQNSCNNCCQMLKKVKKSILSYKKYLQQQGINFQQLVDTYKQKLLDQYLTSN